MARPLRIQFENAYYHVTCRGNARQEIYVQDLDRSVFLRLLARSAEVYQVEVLAYVLMANHFHLLVKTPRANLQEFMRHFNISYTSYFNRAHERTGHLYQGRYKAFLIDADSYLQEVSRYVHLNPLRSQGKARKALAEKKEYLRKYQWSSYPTYLSPRAGRSFLQVREILAYFEGDTPEGRKQYRDFVEEGLTRGMENPLERGKGHGIIGSAAFLERMKEGFLSGQPRSREVPAIRKVIGEVEPERILEAVAMEFQVSREDLLQRGNRGIARPVLMEFLYRYGGLNQREIGELLGIDYSSVSVGRKKLHTLLGKGKGLAARMEGIKGKLTQE
ncbi:MAG: transposase [bacterium]